MPDSPTLARRRASLTLYPGDYPLRLTELTEQIADAEDRERAAKADADPGGKSGGKRLTDKAESLRLAEQYRALCKEAEEGSVTLVVEALPRRKWRDLKDEHPPRHVKGPDDELEVHRDDRSAGVNTSTLFDVANGQCVVEPEFTTKAWDRFADDMSDGDWQALSQVVWSVNEEPTRIPKSSAVSAQIHRSTAASK